MEAWQSGLMHRSWKPTRVWVLREFESHRFRQIIFKYKPNLIINNLSLSWAIKASNVGYTANIVSDQILKKQSDVLLLLFLF